MSGERCEIVCVSRLIRSVANKLGVDARLYIFSRGKGGEAIIVSCPNGRRTSVAPHGWDWTEMPPRELISAIFEAIRRAKIECKCA